MLSFFRRFTKSRYGLIVVFIVLGIIALAFGLTDVTGMRSMGGASNSTVLAKVGSREITDADVRQRIDFYQRAARQEGRNITIGEIIAAGEYENILQDLINTAAIVEFSRKNGLVVNTGVIDSVISSIPGFAGPDGKFDQKNFERFLGDQRISLKTFRDDVADQLYRKWLIAPMIQSGPAPKQLVTPYASLMLQRRTGTVALIRWQDVDPVAAPDDKTLATFFTANRARYLVPERRTIRYAVVKADDIKARSAATDAEIADAYKKAGARFAATEKRSVRQLVLLDQATATKAAAEVKAGKSIADVAKGLGLEAGSFDSLEKPALAHATTAPIANAAFAASEGAVLDPIRSPLGWHVVKVEKVEKIAAKTLEQASPDLAAEITLRKTMTTLNSIRQAIEDSVGEGNTFDQAIATAKLTASRLGPVTANGTDPDNPAVKPDPMLTNVIRTGFALQQGDDPQIVPFGTDGSIALVAPEKIIPAAPRPLDQIRKKVNDDYIIDQALKKARTVARQIADQVNRGVPLQQAIAAAKLGHPTPIEHFDLDRQKLMSMPERSPGVDRAFTLAVKKADVVPDRRAVGFEIVYVDAIEEHDASGNGDLMAKIGGEFGPMLPQEQIVQFVGSIANEVKVTRNEAAIKRLKADLAGGAAAQ